MRNWRTGSASRSASSKRSSRCAASLSRRWTSWRRRSSSGRGRSSPSPRANTTRVTLPKTGFFQANTHLRRHDRECLPRLGRGDGARRGVRYRRRLHAAGRGNQEARSDAAGCLSDPHACRPRGRTRPPDREGGRFGRRSRQRGRSARQARPRSSRASPFRSGGSTSRRATPRAIRRAGRPTTSTASTVRWPSSATRSSPARSAESSPIIAAR